MSERAKVIETIGDSICLVAVGLAVCWIAFADERFKPYMVIVFFAGLTLCVLGSLLHEYQSDASERKRGFWRSFLWFLTLVFIGGAGLSIGEYAIASFDEINKEDFRQTLLMIAGIKVALSALAFLSIRFVR
ncbi:MAG: hypothetical protein JSR78_10380 [Proteobacteria bacterium]|nr:hypothetical protein [Pseudomonadota bacterium]